MRMLSSFVAVGSLLLAAALLPVVGAVLIAFFLFGLFLLALVGVLAGGENHTVRQHDPALDPKGWRNGS